MVRATPCRPPTARMCAAHSAPPWVTAMLRAGRLTCRGATLWTLSKFIPGGLWRMVDHARNFVDHHLARPGCTQTTSTTFLTASPPDSCRNNTTVDALEYFEIRVGDTDASSDNALCASYTAPTQSVFTFACSPPVTGRYLVVRLSPEYAAIRSVSVLMLCEVQAFGTLADFSPRRVDVKHVCFASPHPLPSSC